MRVWSNILAAAVASLLVLPVACTRPVDLVAVPTDGGASTSKDAADTGITHTPTTEAGPTPTSACPPGTTLLLLTLKGGLLMFDPASDAVKYLGAIDCPTYAAGVPISLAVGDDARVYVLYDSGTIIQFPAGTVNATDCKPWGKAPALPTGQNGAGLAISGTKDAAFFLGVDLAIYSASALVDFTVWTQTGKLDPADHVRALLGTGDGRLFGVLGPSATSSYRVTSIDPATGVTGATILVPSDVGSDQPAGFALFSDSLLVFTEKSLTRYNFATGVLSSPEIIGSYGPIVAAASPPCASTL